MTMTMAMASRAMIAGNAAVLHAIRERDVSIAIWERTVPAAFGGIAGGDERTLRFQAAPGAMAGALERQFDEAGYSPGAERALLAADIVMLASRFATIMALGEVEIRLERIVTNACRKFHADYVTARLICTYAGQGTQWLDGEDAPGCDCGDPHNIRQLATGDVALFKGRLWSAHAPAIHRSPPIEGTGEERLVLVINPGEAAADEPIV